VGVERRPTPSPALIQIVVTVVLVVLLVAIAEATQSFWRHYIVFITLGLSPILSWPHARC
jgi:hypothetical protein